MDMERIYCSSKQKRKRALYDFVAGTVVIKKKYENEAEQFNQADAKNTPTIKDVRPYITITYTNIFPPRHHSISLLIFQCFTFKNPS